MGSRCMAKINECKINAYFKSLVHSPYVLVIKHVYKTQNSPLIEEFIESDVNKPCQ